MLPQGGSLTILWTLSSTLPSYSHLPLALACRQIGLYSPNPFLSQQVPSLARLTPSPLPLSLHSQSLPRL